MFANPSSIEDPFPCAAKGTEPLREYLLGTAKPGEWIVNENSSTDASQQEIAAEIVREKIFRSYYSGKDVYSYQYQEMILTTQEKLTDHFIIITCRGAV